MRVNALPPFPILPAADAGTWAVLPLPLDLGGQPGTGAGAAWLGQRIADPEIRQLLGVVYESAPAILTETPFGRIEPSLSAAAMTLQAWQHGYRPLWLFGDHGLAFGPVRAAGLHDRPVSVFVFDAHYDRLDGLLQRMGASSRLVNEVHQGNVATWIGRDPNVARLIQIGVRQRINSSELDSVPCADILTAEQIRADLPASLRWVFGRLRGALDNGHLVVLSIDVDVLDPAIIPAVDHPVPGGLSSAELFQLCLPIAQAACSIDICELNPLRDVDRKGARAALSLVCKLLLAATRDQESRAWLPVLQHPSSKPLAAIGPYTSVIVRGAHWLEPTAVEVGVIEQTPIDELRATFTEAAVRSAVEAIRHNLVGLPAERPVPPAPPVATLAATGALSGGERHVECVAVSHDANRVAAAGWDHGVYIWQLRQPDEAPMRLAGHSRWVVAMQFSPRDDRLATVSDDHTVRIWSLPDGDSIACLGHDDWVKAVAWSPDARRVASGAFNGEIRIWDAATGHCLNRIAAHPAPIWDVAWSPDGKSIASCGDRALMRVWDADTGRPLYACEGHLGAIERCEFGRNAELWSLARGGRLLAHRDGAARPVRRIDCELDQTLDWTLFDDRILVAGPRSIRCLSTDTGQAEAELTADFPIGAVAGWAGRHAIAAGDADRMLLFELPKG